MAGDWIPYETSLPRKREVRLIAKALGITRYEVCGRLLEFWAWASEETADGTLPGLSVDDLVDVLPSTQASHVCDPRHFWNQVIAVGWLVQSEGGLTIPNAEQWITKGAKGRLLKRRRQQRWREGGAHGDAPVDGQASTTGEKRTVTPHGPPRGARKRRGKPEVSAPNFEAFYAAYPKRRGREVARRAWERLAPDEALIATIMAVLPRHSQQEDWRKEGGKYIPHPATWLNGRRWEDELPATVLPGTPGDAAADNPYQGMPLAYTCEQCGEVHRVPYGQPKTCPKGEAA